MVFFVHLQSAHLYGKFHVQCLGLSGKTKHLQLNHIPKKSTLAYANQRRDCQVFGQIYNKLLKQYCHVFSDRRVKDVIKKQI